MALSNEEKLARKRVSTKKYEAENAVAISERKKLYRQNNKEKIKAYKSKRYQETKAAVLATNDAWRSKNREKYSKWSSGYQKSNRDKINARNRKRRIDNPEIAKKNREATAKYRELNPDKIKETANRQRIRRKETGYSWYKNHKPSTIEYQRRFYADPKNYEKRRQSKRAYYQNNKARYLGYAMNRRAAIRKATIGDKSEILEWNDSWRRLESVTCFWCRKETSPSACDADHVVPISRGGIHNMDNLVVSCSTCNAKKHNRMPEEFLKSISHELCVSESPAA